MSAETLPADERVEQIKRWLTRELSWPLSRLEAASNDASFRRYWRVWRGAVSRVVMDAPPDKEDTAPFLRVRALLAGCGVHVPAVEAVDAARGFILMEDLGSEHYLSRLRRGADVESLYTDALGALLQIQVRGADCLAELAPYDRATLERELALMPQWYCERHLQLELTREDREVLAATWRFLCEEAEAQPVVFVHRDYHSRNLMITPRANPGIVDFQDALAGPVGYDLVSLLKDCYVDWPRARVEGWVREYRTRLLAAGGPGGQSEASFLRWFDLIGLQRHLKVLGVFARLWYRDGKSGYLADLPRTLAYVRDVIVRFPELRAFAMWMEQRVEPALVALQARGARKLP